MFNIKLNNDLLFLFNINSAQLKHATNVRINLLSTKKIKTTVIIIINIKFFFESFKKCKEEPNASSQNL